MTKVLLILGNDVALVQRQVRMHATALVDCGHAQQYIKAEWAAFFTLSVAGIVLGMYISCQIKTLCQIHHTTSFSL